MKKKNYESYIEWSEQRSGFDNLIKENSIENVALPGKTFLDNNTNVYFCCINTCGLVIKEESSKLASSTPMLGFTIAHENSLEKIAETKSIIEDKTKLRLKEIK
jgi:hypothetical protein